MKFTGGNRGFTLIELLVVISIIALLSSIILAALSNARQKGVVGSVIEFSDNNYQKLGANVVFDARFNNSLTDLTGNYTSASAATYVNDTPFSDGGASLSMVNVLQYSSVGSLPVQLADSSGFTESAWFKLTLPLGLENIIGGPIGSIKDSSGVSHYITVRFDPSSDTLSCELGNTADAAVASFNWSPDTATWHNVTCTYDSSSNETYLYLDGKLMSSASPGTAFTPASLSGTIKMMPASLYLDDLQFFSGSLLADGVQKLYSLDALAHGIALK